MSRKKEVAEAPVVETPVVESPVVGLDQPVSNAASTLPATERKDPPGDKPWVKFGPYPTSDRNTTLSAAIWRKEVVTETGELVTVYNVGLTRTYYDVNRVPKTSGTIRASEVPLAILLLEKCERYLKDIKGVNGNGH